MPLALVAGAWIFVLAFPLPILRQVFGLLFILVAPGVASMIALDPMRRLPRLERSFLSLALGVALVPLLGLALNETQIGFDLVAYLLVGTLVVVMGLGIAFSRRFLETPVPWARQRLPPAGLFTKSVALALCLFVAGGAGAVASVFHQPRAVSTYTTFEVLDSEGGITAYPKYLLVGSEAKVRIGVTNGEGQNATFLIQIVAQRGKWMDATGQGRVFHPEESVWQENRTLTLRVNEREFVPVEIPFDSSGLYRILFELRLESTPEPIRVLALPVEVFSAPRVGAL